MPLEINASVSVSCIYWLIIYSKHLISILFSEQSLLEPKVIFQNYGESRTLQEEENWQPQQKLQPEPNSVAPRYSKSQLTHCLRPLKHKVTDSETVVVPSGMSLHTDIF